jgi:hypothetical protein
VLAGKATADLASELAARPRSALGLLSEDAVPAVPADAILAERIVQLDQYHIIRYMGRSVA